MKPDVGAGFLGGAALFTIFYFATPDPLQQRLDIQTITLVLLVLTIGTLIAAMLRGAPFDKMVGACGATILGVLYVVLLGGHLVALREGDLGYLHVHPTEGVGGNAVAFEATFPTAGRYRLFFQFKTGGDVRTVAYTVEVPR